MTGAFRGLDPYDESAAALFFGRAQQAAVLAERAVREGARVTALAGPSGIGKTSLLRAGLVPLFARQGVPVLYVGDHATLEQDIWQSASRAGLEAPGAGERPADYVARVARASRTGALLVLDHLETLLGDGTDDAGLRQLGSFLADAVSGVGPRLRLLLCLEARAFHRLDRLHALTGFSPLPGTWTELEGLDQAQATEVLEQTALQTGTLFEAGLAGFIGGDLCRAGRASPADLQIVARMVVELRLGTLRRYERSGGAASLVHAFFDRATRAAGGPVARHVLLGLARRLGAEARVEEVADGHRLSRPRADEILSRLVARGLVRRRDQGRDSSVALAHPCLAERIQRFAALDAASALGARRALERRLAGGARLSLREAFLARRHLRGELSAGEQAVLSRGLRLFVLQVLVVLAGVMLPLLWARAQLRASYFVGFEPSDGSPSARVVVRLGRPNLTRLARLPGSPPVGRVIADTGFAATSLGHDLRARVAQGQAAGSLGRDARAGLPGWLRTVLDGLRPVPRGVTLVLLGDPTGIVSLKQAFADPASRREVLEALAVIGTGRAGEDEILAAALADASAEIRRRGVEVAAAIDRRQGKAAHGTTLRSALADRSFEVRRAVLDECATLDPATAAGVLSVALADQDAAFRRLAERSVLDLADRAPAAAADAVRLALGSAEASARRVGLALIEQIAVRAPDEAAAALGRIVADPRASEEARVSALINLRRTGAPPGLKALIEATVSPGSPPRLRAAALPLHARLVDAATAEDLALAESKGPPAARAAGAAVWGAVALSRPDRALPALKGFLYDPSPEVRIEAARSFGALEREGAALIQKALLDPHAEVQRAAIESAVALGAKQPAAMAEMLNRALQLVRPSSRRFIVDALGRIGRDRPALVVIPLARALKQGDAATRVAAAGTFCALAQKHPGPSAAYLRIAARDPDREVRTAAASCLGRLTTADPKGAARLAAELAGADEASVRAAVAASLGALAGKARDLAIAPLLRLLDDPDRSVRVAAAKAVSVAGSGSAGKRADEAMERALGALYARGDTEERHLALAAAAATGLGSLVRQAAADPDEGLRLEAVRAAAELPAPLLEILQAATQDRSPAVRAEAVRRLAAVSGEHAQQALTVFETMLRSGDPAIRRAAAAALGDVAAAGDAPVRLLETVLRQPGEAVRAAAAEALARLAARQPGPTTPLLEQALADPAHDVRMAAASGLATVWAAARTPAEIAGMLENAEAASPRRLVALEGLVVQAGGGPQSEEARRQLERVATSGPPLARLFACIGRAFVGRSRADMHAFIERLLRG